MQLTSFMFALWVALASSLREKPVVFFPPMFGSVLYGTLTNLKSEHWFCPRNLKDSWIWETDQYLISPITQCMADYLTCAWNETYQTPWSRPEAEIYTIDFGGDGGIRYLDRGFFGYHFVHCLDVLLERFEAGGYVFKIDMYGAPFDWRLNPVPLDDFYKKAKELIELAHMQCQHKVSCIGYSAGCYALHYMLVNKVDQAWKDTYMDKIVMVAPSYGGCFDAVLCAMTGLSWFPDANTTSMKDFLLSLPTLYSHMPNWEVFKGKAMIKTTTGQEYGPEQLRPLLYTLNMIPEKFRPIWDYVEKMVLTTGMADPGVDAVFVVNSGINTTTGVVLDENWDVVEFISEPGDIVLNKDSLYWGVDHWHSGHAILCHDYSTDNETYNHGGMLSLPDVRDDIFDFVVDDSWRVPGNWVHKGKRKSNWLDHIRKA